MSVDYLGSLSIGDAVPAGLAASVAGVAGINLALPDIQARIDSLLAFSPGAVDFAAQLALANQIVLGIQAAISGGLTPPSIAVQIAQIAALIAELLATVTAINVQLGIVVDFQALLGAAGVHGYAFDGDTDQLGPELTTELAGGVPGGGPTDHANAVVLVTTVPATWAAMAQVFKVTP